MPAKDRDVLVVARTHANLDELSNPRGPLLNFSSAATSMAKKVKEGNGRAVIPSSHLRMILDIQAAVNAIFDNFELYDAKTQSPLIWELLKQNKS